MRRYVTYANVVATLALVFAMSGGALAAKHYLVSSTKQISPKVLKTLKGKTGKSGATGKEGAVGKEGAAGKEGKEGKEGLAGSARAYASIAQDGTLDTARSKNVESVKEASTGIYCVKLSPSAGTSSDTTAPVLTPDASHVKSTFQEHMILYVETEPISCEKGELEVVARQDSVSGGVLNEVNHATAFTVVVP